MQELIDKTQRYCTGEVRLKLYKVCLLGMLSPLRALGPPPPALLGLWAKVLLGRGSLGSHPPACTHMLMCPTHPTPLPQGNVTVVGRRSQYSLYSPKIASFEDDQGAYDQKDAAGFIKLQVRA